MRALPAVLGLVLIPALAGAAPTQELADFVVPAHAPLDPDALAWLARAQARLQEQPAWEARIRSRSGEDAATVGRFLLQVGAPGLLAIGEDDTLRRPDGAGLGALGLHPALAGCLPWVLALDPQAAAVPLAGLRLAPVPADAPAATRLEWVSDGLRGRVDLDQDAWPLAWAIEADPYWERTPGSRAELLELRAVPARTRFPAPRPAAAPRPLPLPELAGLPAAEATRVLLGSFAAARCLRVELSTEVWVGAGETATRFGRVRSSGHLRWPRAGLLQLSGSLGRGEEERRVDTWLAGDGQQLWHWERVADSLRSIPRLGELVAGFEGLLPLQAWAAQTLPDAAWQARWEDEPSGRWLVVEDGATTSRLRLADAQLREVQVRARDAGSGAPELRYRIELLAPCSGCPHAPGVPEELSARLARAADEGPDGPQHSQVLLPIGRTAPGLRYSTAAGEARELSALRGRPVVLVFWQRDALSCEPLLRRVAALAAQAAEAGDPTVFLALAVGEEPAAAQAWLRERELSLECGSLLDPAQARRDFALRALPVRYWLDGAGRVLAGELGGL